MINIDKSVEMTMINGMHPYSYKKRYRFFFICNWTIFYEDTPIHIIGGSESDIADIVFLLNYAYQEGYISKLSH